MMKYVIGVLLLTGSLGAKVSDNAEYRMLSSVHMDEVAFYNGEGGWQPQPGHESYYEEQHEIHRREQEQKKQQYRQAVAQLHAAITNKNKVQVERLINMINAEARAVNPSNPEDAATEAIARFVNKIYKGNHPLDLITSEEIRELLIKAGSKQKEGCSSCFC